VFAAALAVAGGCLRNGVEYVLGLPAEATALRTFCGLPIAWGALTLTRAQQDPSQAKIGRDAIGETIARFGTLAGDDAALREWMGELLAPLPTSGSET
jgi:hypothetical protein